VNWIELFFMRKPLFSLHVAVRSEKENEGKFLFSFCTTSSFKELKTIIPLVFGIVLFTLLVHVKNLIDHLQLTLG